MSYTTFGDGKLIIEGRTVSCDVTNTGSVRGAEVVQLYVGFGNQRFGKDQREETVKQLRGFGKYYLNPSETVRATFELTDRDLSYWDIENARWELKIGKAEVSVGSSCTDIRATGTMNVH